MKENKKRTLFRILKSSPDIIIFCLLLIAANFHLVAGRLWYYMVFVPEPVIMSGQLWRVVTFPFVHWSFYHLILDAGAFFLLYSALEEKRIIKRVLYLLIINAASLVTVLMASDAVYKIGLSGLSGIAHGLMAVTGLEMMRDRELFKIGLTCFALVVAKSMYEAFSGHVFFDLNMCGTPIAVSHAGGTIGGIFAFWLFNRKNSGKTEIV